ncbi:MAG: hypothetical protein U9O59_00310 [Actinomycetota bacterium]|nr:hypothetical protein [Actinomycetota bacterium]
MQQKKGLRYLITISTYLIVFFFILFNLPKFTYADDNDNKPEVNVNIEVNKGGKNEIDKSVEFNGDTEPVININIDKESDDDDRDEDDDGDERNCRNCKIFKSLKDRFDRDDEDEDEEEENRDDGDDNNSNDNENHDNDNGNDQGENGNNGNGEDIDNNDDEENNQDGNESQENGEDDNYENTNNGTEDYDNEVNESNEDNDEENNHLYDKNYHYIQYISNAILSCDASKQERTIEQKGNPKKFGSSSAITGREPISSTKSPAPVINNLLDESLNTKKEKIKQNLEISVNGAGDILNLNCIIERYEVTKVVNFDEIIDIYYEKDKVSEKKSDWEQNLPELILNFWNKIKELASFYS